MLPMSLFETLCAYEETKLRWRYKQIVTIIASMPKSKFVDEVLVEGALYHLLDCGHVHPAVNVGKSLVPATEQDCEKCGRAELQRLPN